MLKLSSRHDETTLYIVFLHILQQQCFHNSSYVLLSDMINSCFIYCIYQASHLTELKLIIKKNSGQLELNLKQRRCKSTLSYNHKLINNSSTPLNLMINTQQNATTHLA